MQPLFEVVIPLRQPTEVLLQTARSLVEQTDRSFAVLLSDNSPGTLSPLTEQARALLQAVGLPTRIVRPPEELGRVEHWNWSHHQTEAEWIKPLFVGDWLSPTYAATLRAVLESQPTAEIINCSLQIHHAHGHLEEVRYPGGYRTPQAVLAEACRVGNNFGGPVGLCFRRLAFVSVGGYTPALPVSGDFWLLLQIALRRGLHTIAEPLAHFHYHPARFSSNMPHRRLFGDRELLIILLGATSQADFGEIPVPVAKRNRFFGFLLQRTLKAWLKRHLPWLPR